MTSLKRLAPLEAIKINLPYSALCLFKSICITEIDRDYHCSIAVETNIDKEWWYAYINKPHNYMGKENMCTNAYTNLGI